MKGMQSIAMYNSPDGRLEHVGVLGYNSRTCWKIILQSLKNAFFSAKTVRVLHWRPASGSCPSSWFRAVGDAMWQKMIDTAPFYQVISLDAFPQLLFPCIGHAISQMHVRYLVYVATYITPYASTAWMKTIFVCAYGVCISKPSLSSGVYDTMFL